MRKIYLTESQFNYILKQQMINEGVMKNLFMKLFGETSSSHDLALQLIAMIGAGIMTASMAVDMVNANRGTMINNEVATEVVEEIAEKAPVQEWLEVCNDAIVTVYNAKKEQCNADVQHTASMFRLNLKNPGAHRIVALERTFMQELGLKFGDVIKIEGTHRGAQDGVYQVQDVMNKRFKGMHKVDVLVPNEITTGGTYRSKDGKIDERAKIYVLNDKADSQKYLQLMAPQAKKVKNNKVVNK